MPRTKPPTTDPIEILYLKHAGIIHERAQSFHLTTGLPLDDLTSRSNWMFMRAVSRWDEDRGKFSTFLYRLLTNELKLYTGKHLKPTQVVREYNELMDQRTRDHQQPNSSWRLDEFVSNLSEEAATIVMLLLECPGEAFGLVGGEGLTAIRTAIRRALLHRADWNPNKTKRVLKEISQHLHDLEAT